MSPTPLPDDNLAYRFPVSIKGVIFRQSRVVLLKNRRDEWELPGGKLEPEESPQGCLTREVHEELGLSVQIGPLLDAWVYHIHEEIDVLIVTYGCYPGPHSEITHSPEHKAVGLFRPDEVEALKMPEGYKQSVRAWRERLARSGPLPR